MKLIHYFTWIIVSLGLFISCRDESLDPNVTPESGVHGFGEVASGGFIADSIPGSAVNLEVQWISIDNRVTIDRIEMYVRFFEEYTNSDGNIITAVHGGTGITTPDLVLTGLTNRTPGQITITPDQVYQIFKDVTYAYDDVNQVPVFANPDKARPAESRFLPGDSFEISWRLYGSDGRVYRSWSPSVCTEVRGANCTVEWAVE